MGASGRDRFMLKRSRALASVALVALTMGATPVLAESLQEAIGLAYRTNPTLLARLPPVCARRSMLRLA